MTFFFLYILVLIIFVKFITSTCKNLMSADRYYFDSNHYYDYNGMIEFDPYKD
jgi:hypothetical protein